MKKLLFWGTGDLTNQFLGNGYQGEIVGFIETNKTKDEFMQRPVYDSLGIPKTGFDYIVVTNSYGLDIYALCIKQNIDTSKLIFPYAIQKRVGCTDESILKEIFSPQNYNDYCVRFKLKPKKQLIFGENDWILDDAAKYQKMNQRPTFAIQEKYMWPIATDKFDKAGAMEHYFWQDLWAAKLIYRSGDKKHFDIGSSIDSFIAHLLAMDVEVTMIDIREFPAEVENLRTIVDDATSLKQIPDESIESMSALCSLEHFGLGRYGDPIDPEACFKCFENIQMKMKKGGKLYISVPIGAERLAFNAHRIFYASTIVECFSGMKLQEFSCAKLGEIEYNVNIHKYDNEYSEEIFGLFYFIKKS